jgi:hypothetical protein
MQIFAIWFEECCCRISKGHGLMLVGLGFAKCYINDIMVFSLTPRNHMHHLQDVFRRLKEHNFKLHPSKC